MMRTIDNEEELKLDEFRKKMQDIIEKIGLTEVKPNERAIKKFCELIGDTNAIYFDKNAAIQKGFNDIIIPPGYIMNFTNPVTQDIFIRGGPSLLPGIIKGVIHVGSKVEYMRPMEMNKTYNIKIDMNQPNKKSGTKGIYYSVVVKLSIMSKDGLEIYAIDNHEFFFKLS